MVTDLAPKHSLKIGLSNVLWFETSNQYIVVSNILMAILDLYFASNNHEQFLKQLQSDLDISPHQAKVYYKEITELLSSSNRNSESDIKKHKSPLIPNQGIEEIYCFGDTSITINFGSEKIKAFIHPQWAHTTAKQTNTIVGNFHIFKDGKYLYLFKDDVCIGHYPVGDYHLLQGQFALQLINALYQKNEVDWIATFHASTVCNDKEAIMIIGDSGNGKSTLSAVLMANGFDVLADDFTPLSAQNSEVFRFPSGISVKEGAFSMIQSMYPDFDKFPLYSSTSKNVNIKYIPPVKGFNQSKDHFPCTKIVYVKYDAQAKSQLKEIEIDDILKTLIPESWISPLASNSKLFLDWLKDLQCFELHYSDNATAVSKFSELFDY